MIAGASLVAAESAFPPRRLGRAGFSRPSEAAAPDPRFDAASGLARRFAAAAAEAPCFVFCLAFMVMFASFARVPGEIPAGTAQSPAFRAASATRLPCRLAGSDALHVAEVQSENQ
jgi:hypothetical protein